MDTRQLVPTHLHHGVQINFLEFHVENLECNVELSRNQNKNVVVPAAAEWWHCAALCGASPGLSGHWAPDTHAARASTAALAIPALKYFLHITWIQIFFARYNISTMFIIYIRYVFAQIWKNIYHFKNIFMARNRRLEISTVILCGETLAFHHSACWQDTTWPLQRYWTLCESHLIVRTKVRTSSTSSTYSHHSDRDPRGTWFNSFSWYANGWVMQQDKPALTSLFDTPFCQSNII